MEIRAVFHKRLREIQDDVLAMGSMVEKATSRSIEALKERDLDKAHELIADDLKINKKRFNIEEKCVQLIATQQPMASDLRTILAISNIAAELERIGDYAEGIGRLAIKLSDRPLLKPLIDIPRMAKVGRRMLTTALEAFARQDSAAAEAVGKADDELDALYDQVYRELLVFMMEDPRTITQATYLLWVAHNLERIGDRTTNIAERVIFLNSGKIVDLNR